MNQSCLILLASTSLIVSAALADDVSQSPLKEFRNRLCIHIEPSTSRLFFVNDCRIARISVADPAIAEPVVLKEDQLYVLGKTPGRTTLSIWGDKGQVVGMDVQVTKESAKETEIPKKQVESVKLSDCAMEAADLKLFEEKRQIFQKAVISRNKSAKLAASPFSEAKKVVQPNFLSPQLTITVRRSSSRTLSHPKNIRSIESEDTSIAEGVILTPDDTNFVMLGKRIGVTPVVLKDDTGKSFVFNVKVVDAESTAPYEAMPLTESSELYLDENKIDHRYVTKVTVPLMLHVSHPVTRICISDPAFGAVLPGPGCLYFVGSKPGHVTVDLWDDHGAVSVIDWKIVATNIADVITPSKSSRTRKPSVFAEVEYWEGARKSVWMAPNEIQ